MRNDPVYQHAYYLQHRETILARLRTGMPPGPRPVSAYDRVMTRVSKESNGCWLWTGPLLRGYGRIFVRRDIGRRQVHRIVWEHLRGEIAPGLQLDHLCRHRHCVNPEHLEPVTPRENTLRSEAFTAKNAQKTSCSRGHPFTPENTYRWRQGRCCRICLRATQRRWVDKRKAAAAR